MTTPSLTRARFRFVLQACLAFCLAGLSLAELDYTLPPHDGIEDRGEFLSREYRQTIKDRIAYERRNRNFEIFVIIFEEPPEEEAKKVARLAGEGWSTSQFWAVVYQVGKEGSPACLVGGGKMEQISPEVVEHTLRGARGAAMLVEAKQGRVEEMVSNLGDGFGFLYEKADQRFQKALKERAQKMAAEERRKKSWKIVLLSLFVIFLALGALAFYLWSNYLRKMKPVEFPVTSPRRRLAAPSSGGGDVLVKYRKEI